jgi:hypothetical protein
VSETSIYSILLGTLYHTIASPARSVSDVPERPRFQSRSLRARSQFATISPATTNTQRPERVSNTEQARWLAGRRPTVAPRPSRKESA